MPRGERGGEAMKYDDASWHYGGDFPKDLPIEAGATHTGMFLAWALLSDLAGPIFEEDYPDLIPSLRRREITPGLFFLHQCDGKFIDEYLNRMGNDFAQDYFDFEHGNFLADYEEILGAGLPSTYHVQDTWENFERLKPRIDQRFESWKGQRKVR
jgi:hypothetical protein